jgi:hypothetical protein
VTITTNKGGSCRDSLGCLRRSTPQNALVSAVAFIASTRWSVQSPVTRSGMTSRRPVPGVGYRGGVGPGFGTAGTTQHPVAAGVETSSQVGGHANAALAKPASPGHGRRVGQALMSGQPRNKTRHPIVVNRDRGPGLTLGRDAERTREKRWVPSVRASKLPRSLFDGSPDPAPTFGRPEARTAHPPESPSPRRRRIA